MSSRLGTALRRNRGIRGALTVAATIAVSAAVLAPAPQAKATAVTTARTATAVTTATINGTMRKDFTARIAPTKYAPGVTLLKEGTVIRLRCQVWGDSVHGNYLWYKVADARWVTAYYVHLNGAPPFCGNGTLYKGHVTISSLAVRNGPNTQDPRVAWASGNLTNLVCKVVSQNVDGNSIWYERTGGNATNGGRWVAARFVSNVGSAPPYC
ncbi:hypothetical protein SAMN05421678_12315 [Actinopolymorpha cephalotaxi]|uniref:SH3 domain-containing protein n=1 Tax=Actinopolymorpha cephalotaxi TaxID=504797 RepID=A0A1I3BBI0_9ACTN|nr:hypothetical protein [Actinopolymorpha cephalotaxi]NYH86807.1 hypothetical protein [Actinopolymorpha cephalotaxi]SFH59051.1 hypothetical protein SAMN05421678_12315 [Actinopolymorpha cephalotaxi]